MGQSSIPRNEDGSPRFARGWYVLGASEDFAAGEPVAARYFGVDLVIFRGEDGKLGLLDAYCPHLGAHLAHGGKVEGGALRCPFHGWRFERDGTCSDVPYGTRIPKSACVRSWTLLERNGLAFVWQDPDGNAPDFEIPVLEEWGKPGWTTWKISEREIRTHPREIVENVADVAHFKVVHGLTGVEHFENIYDRHMATQIMVGTGTSRGVRTEATYYGPAYQITRMQSLVESRLLNSHIPVDEDKLILRFGVMIQESEFSAEDKRQIARSLKNLGLDENFELSKKNLGYVHQGIVDNLTKGYHEDVDIWEYKVWRDNPLLCDGDGPIPKLRRWYSQFYKPAVAAQG